MNPMLLASLGLGGVGMIGGIINSFRSNGQLQRLLGKEPTYQSSPYAAQRLNLAQTLLNARMPGAVSMERNIYGNQANQMANINRNATDSAQALAMGASAQGQTNQAFQNLASQEQQDYYNRLQNLTGAQQGMISEGDKVYQDQVRKFQDLSAITGAQLQNRQTAWNSLANMGIGGAGLASQLGNWGRGGTNTGNMPSPAAASSFMGMQPVQTAQGPQGMNLGWINPYMNSDYGVSGYPGMSVPGNF